MGESTSKRGRPRKSTQVVAPSSGVPGVLVKTETVETPLDCELSLHDGPAYADPLDTVGKFPKLPATRVAPTEMHRNDRGK